jgi:hypothetical protein
MSAALISSPKPFANPAGECRFRKREERGQNLETVCLLALAAAKVVIAKRPKKRTLD